MCWAGSETCETSQKKNEANLADLRQDKDFQRKQKAVLALCNPEYAANVNGGRV